MRDFRRVKRIVVKVGTNVLSKNGRVDTEFIRVIARQISQIAKEGRQVILVTSGAIGMGAGHLGIRKPIREVPLRQACAAVGQGILMREYQDAFAQYQQPVAQVLLTNQVMNRRKNYVNLKNTFETLLRMSVVPIVNENDSVSIDEIDLAFGDNDRLSALVASKIDAELLIILTDVDGLYESDPRENKNAQKLSVVYEVTPEIESMAGQAGSQFGTGGMQTKLEAIKIASRAGCRVVLANGREEEVIHRILAGEEVGTLFLPRKRLSNRKRWILNARPSGTLYIDDGAAQSILNRRSLLFVGLKDVSGNFSTGQVVEIGSIAKGICNFSSEQLRQMLEARRYSLKKNNKRSQVIVHANNIVLLDS